MKAPDNCPTCGTTLGPLHADALRHCEACQKPNPRGFRYCGFCAAPMEREAHRAERAQVAAPPGGWPNLSRELVELRFYMDRGELDEAFELLTILRQRHPGHPALAEFRRTPEGQKPRPDTQVNRVVDSVLAGSQSLSSALPRRSVPQWKAPAAERKSEAPRKRTSPEARKRKSPEARKRKSPEARDSKPDKTIEGRPPMPRKEPPAVRKRVVRSDGTPGALQPAGTPHKFGRQVTDKHLGAVPLSTPGGAPLAHPSGSSEDSGPDAITKPEPIAKTPAKLDPAALAQRPPLDPADARSGVTIAVPTLQPPAPYRDEEGDVPQRSRAKAAKSVARKRSLKSQKRTGKQAIAEQQRQAQGQPRRPVRGTSFGQHVLGRLGKDKRTTKG